MTSRNSETETPGRDEERRRTDERLDRLFRQARESLASAKRHREAAEYWNAIARSERRRGIFR